ncbi:hypothetical protein [Legionella quinlivanii]|uniref:hypothetical protein n=1 Tax=Legionella quinlivanii TaxID=45073 RepID=UPI0022441A12|nr:hypothetical protein [Legionella quinlivanii]MCW8452592.1 hypothetical protein [Legionella quinlivanii]
MEHSRKDIFNLPCHPDFFRSDVAVFDNFRGLIECLNETTILMNTSDNFGVELAIRIALFKYSLNQGYTPDWENFSIPNIGKSFRESCQKCCRAQGDSLPHKILRAIVETIKGVNLSAVHALRSTQGGNSPQKLRGADKAQRRDIDREFHLHYWECANSTIELGLVVYHNDFTIPE